MNSTSTTNIFDKNTKPYDIPEVLADIEYQTFSTLISLREICSIKMLWAAYLLCYLNTKCIPQTPNMFKSALQTLYSVDNESYFRFSRSQHTRYACEQFGSMIENELTYLKGFSYRDKKNKDLLEKYYKVLENYKHNAYVIDRNPSLAYTSFKQVETEELEKLIMVLQVTEFRETNEIVKLKKLIGKSKRG